MPSKELSLTMRESLPRRTISRRLLLCGIFSYLLQSDGPFLTSAKAAEGDIAVVVNAGVSVNDLRMADLRKILLGDRQYWVSSQRITLLVRGPGARERDVMLKRVYQMSEAQFRQYWIAKVFRAETAAGPKTIPLNKIAVDLLRGLPGTIAFINATEVPKDLKVLKIDGRLPGDKGYALAD